MPPLTQPMPIRALHAQRWEVELHFHQIKILLGLDILRCNGPELIEKETSLHLIAYNLIRLLMQQAASTHAASLGRISFKGALDTVRHFAPPSTRRGRRRASKTP